MNILPFQFVTQHEPTFCRGCDKWVNIVDDIGYCPVWRVAAMRSYERRGGCPMNYQEEIIERRTINPLKASKRSRRG